MEAFPSLGDEPEPEPSASQSGLTSPLGYFSCPAIGQEGWMSSNEIRLPMSDLGFRQGVTAVERMRTYSGVLFNVDRHMRRFRQTVDLMGISASLPIDLIAKVVDQTLARNRDWVANEGDVGMTLWATPGSAVVAGTRPSRGTFAVHLNPIDHQSVQRRRQSGQAIVLTDVVQPSPRSWSRWAKVRSRLHYFLADQNAQEIHPQSTGVLQDEDGTWTESSIANLGLVLDDELIFPPSEQVLCGVTQAHVGELARNGGIRCRHQRITTNDIMAAETILLMGTDTGLWFASEVLDARGNRVRSFNTPNTHSSGQVSLVRTLQSQMPGP